MEKRFEVHLDGVAYRVGEDGLYSHERADGEHRVILGRVMEGRSWQVAYGVMGFGGLWVTHWTPCMFDLEKEEWNVVKQVLWEESEEWLAGARLEQLLGKWGGVAAAEEGLLMGRETIFTSVGVSEDE